MMFTNEEKAAEIAALLTSTVRAEAKKMAEPIQNMRVVAALAKRRAVLESILADYSVQNAPPSGSDTTLTYGNPTP